MIAYQTIKKSMTVYLPLSLFLVFVLFPVYWMILTAFRPEAEIYFAGSKLWPGNITLVNYKNLISQTDFKTWLTNSVIVGFSSAFLAMVMGSLAGYGLTRLRLPGQGSMGMIILLSYLVPRTILFVPLYAVLSRFGGTNNIWALVITYPTFTVPFCTWMLMGYFRSIPYEVEECAMIDGCSRLSAFFRIVLPMAAPGIVAAGIFALTLSWNEYIYALAFTNSSDVRTAPVGLAGLEGGDVIIYGQIMAGSTLITLPIVVLYFFLQRFLVEGLTAGAVKG